MKLSDITSRLAGKGKSSILNLLLVIALIVLLNLIASGFVLRWDMTDEQRYSLSPLTKDMMGDLQHPVFVSVYLEGDFPANIRKFQDGLRSTLIELKQYAGNGLDFEFVNPSDNAALLAELRKLGVSPIPVRVRKSATETEQTLLWPIVVIRRQDREQYVDLSKGCTLPTGEVDFGKAEADLEYKLVSAIRNLSRERRGVVALLQGHGEPSPQQMPQFLGELQNSYTVFTLNLAASGGDLSPSIDLLVVVQPQTAFSEREKYEIDQYLMRGGNILWVLDQQIADLDLYEKRSTLTRLQELNLDDLFFQYGFKLNYNLLQDLSCEATELFQETPSGGTFVSRKWLYYPLVLSLPPHPVARNVDAVLLRYAGSIDSLPKEGLRHSVFLSTSPYSRSLEGSQFIDLNELLQNPPPQAMFNAGRQIAGMTIEGTFFSLFSGREIPRDTAFPEKPGAPFLERSDRASLLKEFLESRDSVPADYKIRDYLARAARPRRMAVISDGEFALGKSFRGQRRNLPYDNGDLLLNVVDYLSGDDTMNAIRSKEVAERRLDPARVRGRVPLIRALNLALPVLLIALFGWFRSQRRRRINQRYQQP